MTDVTNLIKDLRNKTGAGFLDCKTALKENNNDIVKETLIYQGIKTNKKIREDYKKKEESW